MTRSGTGTGSVAEHLACAGMSAAEAERKERLLARVTAAVRGMVRSDASAVRSFWVPGRIEFLGKHTDYAGGRSLLCSVERGFCVAVAARPDRRIRIHDVRYNDAVEAVLGPDLVPEVGHWSNYPLTVARRVARDFGNSLVGADIALASDLPSAAGMSSSSALIVAVFLALAEVNDLAGRPEYAREIHNVEDLAGYLGTVENGQSYGALAGGRGVGTFGGSEDHTAILCARPRTLVQHAFCPVRFERAAPLPADHVFVVASSGVEAIKTGAARDQYNEAARSARAVLDRWNAATGRTDVTLAAAVASAPDAVGALRDALRATVRDRSDAHRLLDRLEQFVTESEVLVPAVGDALERGDVTLVGELVDRSQRSAERLLGNQVPETIWLARSARELGAAAASAFGAGFGGSVWALVRTDARDEFIARWAASYANRFPEAAGRSEFFMTDAGPPAMRV